MGFTIDEIIKTSEVLDRDDRMTEWLRLSRGMAFSRGNRSMSLHIIVQIARLLTKQGVSNLTATF